MLFIPNTNIGLQQRGCQNWDYCVMGYLFQIAVNQELFHFNAPGKLYSTGYYPLYRGTGTCPLMHKNGIVAESSPLLLLVDFINSFRLALLQVTAGSGRLEGHGRCLALPASRSTVLVLHSLVASLQGLGGQVLA